MILIQAIPNAMVNDLVGRNVADLAALPTGSPVFCTSRGGPMYATDVRLRAPLPSRWARCSRAEERQTEAKADPLGSQLGYQGLDRSDD